MELENMNITELEQLQKRVAHELSRKVMESRLTTENLAARRLMYLLDEVPQPTKYGLETVFVMGERVYENGVVGRADQLTAHSEAPRCYGERINDFFNDCHSGATERYWLATSTRYDKPGVDKEETRKILKMSGDFKLLAKVFEM